MCSLGELGDADRPLDRDERDHPVLEQGELLLVRLRGQQIEALVDLERVRRNSDGVLPTPAQEPSQLDRNLGLPHRSGPEDRDQRETGDPSPASVVDVALVISTSTSSPGSPRPTKLTVLLWRVRPRSLAGSVRLVPSTSTCCRVPTKRWLRSYAFCCTSSTSLPIRSCLTGWGS